jgi:hypothetical protein
MAYNSFAPWPVLTVVKVTASVVCKLWFNVTLEPVTVKVLELVPPATEKPSALAVKVKPLMEVAVATPKVGVTKVGEVAKTILPDPVVELPNKVKVPEASGKV